MPLRSSRRTLAVPVPVRGENHGAVLVLGYNAHDHVPHEAPRHRVHACAWLVKEYNLRHETTAEGLVLGMSGLGATLLPCEAFWPVIRRAEGPQEAEHLVKSASFTAHLSRKLERLAPARFCTVRDSKCDNCRTDRILSLLVCWL